MRSHRWLLPAAAALLACCVAARMRILSLLLSWASGVQLTVSQLTLDVDRAASITIVAHEMLAFSPGARADGLAHDHHLLANVSRATISLRRPETCAAASRLACLLDFRGDVSVEGVHLHFISYDALLADTNVKRLLLALGADESAATGALPTAADDVDVSPAFVTMEAVSLRSVAIHSSLRQGLLQVALPPVTLLDETVELRKLGAGLSVGLLNWLAAIVYRTLARLGLGVGLG